MPKNILGINLALHLRYLMVVLMKLVKFVQTKYFGKLRNKIVYLLVGESVFLIRSTVNEEINN